MTSESLPQHVFFSRFSHRVEKEGICAYFHSLRLKPVFIAAAMADVVEALRECSSTTDLLDSLADSGLREQACSVINALIASKVLLREKSSDDKVISHLRSSIPQPYPHIAYFILTENCNFGCTYCFVKRDGSTKPSENNMSLETAMKGLDFFCDQIAKDEKRFNEEKNIIFYGGEPLLNTKVLKSLLEKIEQNKNNGRLPERTQLSIITNGSLLNQQNIELLTKNNVSIGISLDGDECATDSCRAYVNGTPVYKDVIRGIERCKKQDVPFSLSVTLTEQSVKDFDNTIKELQSIDCKALGFNILLTDEAFKVSEGYNEAAADFIIKAFEIFRKSGVYEDRMMRKVKSFVESKVYLFDCGAAGGGQIIIAPDGQVGICHGFLGSREYFPTTVNATAFDPATDPTFSEWGKRTPLNMEECQNCMSLGMCGGGCPLNAQKNEGSIWGMDKRFCVHSLKTLNWLIWDLYDKAKIDPITA